MRWLPVLVMLLFAGCTEAEPAEDEALPVNDEPQASKPWVTKMEGALNGAGGCPEATGPFAAGALSFPDPFGVRDNSVAMIVEAKFDGAFVRSCILLFDGLGGEHFFAQEGTAIMHESMRIKLADPPGGEWTAFVYFEGPAVATYEVAISSFLEEPAADYTAW